MRKLFLVVITFLSMHLYAQKVPQIKIAKEAQKIIGNLVYIPAGTFVTSHGYDFGVLQNNSQLLQGHTDFKYNPSPTEVINRQVSVSSFYMQETEVTNLQWRTFQEAMQKKLGMEAAKKYLPDTTCWETDFEKMYNDPLVKYYYSHPSYDNYPVTGVSWEQIQAYCLWLTEEVNKIQDAKGIPLLPLLRLPSEMEWEYAARGGLDRNLFPWANKGFHNSKEKKHNGYLANMGAVIDKDNCRISEFSDDDYAYTAPVKSFSPNPFKLYDMAGNVSEWVLDDYTLISLDNKIVIREEKDPVKVCKGGSWVSGPAYMFCASRSGVKADQKHSFMGFRVAMIIPGKTSPK